MTDRNRNRGRRVHPAEQLRAFVNALPDLLFVLDEDGRYVEVLSSGDELLYAERERLIGRLMSDVLPPAKARLFLNTVRKTIRTRKPQVLEYELDVPAGTRYFEGRTSPLKANANGKAMVVWVSRDITDRKRAEERVLRAAEETRQAYRELKSAQAQLIRSEKLASIGMLVSGVAHEINNPLHVIFGNLTLLSSFLRVRSILPVTRGSGRKMSRVRIMRMFRDALKAARHAKRIVEEFRHFSRDTASAEFVDLNECLTATFAVFRRGLRPSIKLESRLGRIPPVQCLPGQMTQVFLNLLRNAHDAIEGRGTISVRSSRKGPEVVVEVRDSGRGMSDEVRAKIYEPFFTTKPVGQGLGLGLSVSAMIIENHRGRIVSASRPGRGSVFRVILPVVQPEKLPAKPNTSRIRKLGTE